MRPRRTEVVCEIAGLRPPFDCGVNRNLVAGGIVNPVRQRSAGSSPAATAYGSTIHAAGDTGNACFAPMPEGVVRQARGAKAEAARVRNHQGIIRAKCKCAGRVRRAAPLPGGMNSSAGVRRGGRLPVSSNIPSASNLGSGLGAIPNPKPASCRWRMYRRLQVDAARASRRCPAGAGREPIPAQPHRAAGSGGTSNTT